MRDSSDSTIGDVSDTALWVATYRAEESERADALFRDPLARLLAGERGPKIARKMSDSKYTSWAMAIRTVVIDNYIREMLNEGVDTVMNLGAGLDTRPYRLDLPPTFKWIEVDFPHMIQHKDKVLHNHKPHCQLRRVAMDLTDRKLRQQLFTEINSQSKRILVLTEGVTPYLSEEDVADLADDLRSQNHFAYWITDYFAPQVMRYLRRRRRRKELKNAPFQFLPKDWFGFFADHGWTAREIRYLGNESEKIGRPIPLPWWAAVIRFLIGGKLKINFRQFAAYVLLRQS